MDGSSVDDNSFVLNAFKCFGISRLSVGKVEVLEGSMERKHLVITCTLTVNNQEISTHGLMDCGATGIAFMDQDFARHHHMQLVELKFIRQVEVIDGRPIDSGDITHIATVGVRFPDHNGWLPMCVTKLGDHPIVLQILWLRLHDAAIQFASNIATFGSQYCIIHCYVAPVTVHGITEEPPEPDYPSSKGIFPLQIWPQCPFGGNIIHAQWILMSLSIK